MLLTSTVNCGTAAPVQFSVTSPRPVLAYAFPRRISGVEPVNTPTVPRTWFRRSPVGSQLKPMRGERSTAVFGFVPVFTAGSPFAANALAIASFCTGSSRNRGMSARTP
jgi:hypothetical protein